MQVMETHPARDPGGARDVDEVAFSSPPCCGHEEERGVDEGFQQLGVGRRCKNGLNDVVDEGRFNAISLTQGLR